MNSDFKDLLHLFAKHEVRYLVVGGYAAMHYSQPRFTKDLDLWLEPTPANAQHVMRAPVLLDFLTSLPEMRFPDCWGARLVDESEGLPIHYLSKAALMKAKKLAGRPQDIADLDDIRRTDEQTG